MAIGDRVHDPEQAVQLRRGSAWKGFDHVSVSSILLVIPTRIVFANTEIEWEPAARADREIVFHGAQLTMLFGSAPYEHWLVS
jgi:hypothetical protein